MMLRCNNASNAAFPYYGARGISVCERWHKFVNFLADMGERPEGKTLDRIDTNGPYSPENCRWATVGEQGSNRRSNRKFTAFGLTANLTQWAEFTGLSHGTISARLRKGWSPERIVTQPLDHTKSH